MGLGLSISFLILTDIQLELCRYNRSCGVPPVWGQEGS